jgi:fumarate reductase subunit D
MAQQKRRGLLGRIFAAGMFYSVYAVLNLAKAFEPLMWALFSAGGIVAALLVPIHVAILGIAFPAGWLPEYALSYERVYGLVSNPLTKLYLAALISLPLYHWAHRFRFTLHHEIGIHGAKGLIALACYGAAATGTLITLGLLLLIGF